MTEAKYVVIAEYKTESALAHETLLSKASLEQAHARMKGLAASPDIIRVAIAKLVYEAGHEGLIEPEQNSQ